MPTGNEIYLDVALRHQVGVRRFTAGEVKRITAMMDRANVELIDRLRSRLARLPANNPQSKALSNLIRAVRKQRAELLSAMQAEFTKNMRKFSKLEAAFEIDMMKEGLPVELSFNRVAPQTLRSLVTSKPFSGGPGAARTMNGWFQGLKRADQNRLTDAIRLGVLQGETVDQMARRISGTRASGFTDGILGISRRQSEAVVRTGVNHVSNAAREEAWNANADIIEALQWNGTLDGRTSAICRARDGRFTSVGDKGLPAELAKNALNPGGARPPAHPNCRSIMTAIFSTDGVADQMGERPFVRDTRTRRMREKDFRAEAKAKIGADRWKSLTPQERNGEIRTLRRAWTKKNVGTVPENMTYHQWLKKQPAKFQNEVLGVSKGKLFRTGQIRMDQFVDRAGAEFTLAQLAAKRPAVFRRAGIDPVTLRPIKPIGPKKRVPKTSSDPLSKDLNPLEHSKALTRTSAHTHPKIYDDFIEGTEAKWSIEKGKDTASMFGNRQSATEAADKIARKVAKKLGVSSKVAREITRDMILKWNGTSNDSDMLALYTQKMAAKEFGTKLSTWQIKKMARLKSHGHGEPTFWDFVSDLPDGFNKDAATRIILRAIYEETQAKFRRQGIKEIVIFRGQSLNKKMMGQFREAGNGIAELSGSNVLESWSMNSLVARNFGGSFGVTMTTTVPVERVFSAGFSVGFGVGSEWEIVLLSNTKKLNHVWLTVR